MANKIRVYELAKELNKTSKEVMSLLAEKNIEVTTHMATLEDNQADMVRAQAGQAKQETPKTGDTPKASEDAHPKYTIRRTAVIERVRREDRHSRRHRQPNRYRNRYRNRQQLRRQKQNRRQNLK